MNKRTLINKEKKKILEAIRCGSFSKINNKQTEKRLKWLEENIDVVSEKSLVRKAYVLLLIKKMEIDPKEVPVIFESPTKITWHSYNWCPTLEACKELRIDTREICKCGWEESVKAFVKRIDPRLTFNRNYLNLRPYGEYCEETIELME
jgi:hypothetical protein